MAKLIKADGLDQAIALILNPPRQPDEFTAHDFWERSKAAGHIQTINGIRSALLRNVQSGTLDSRQTCENGKIVTLYKVKQ